jgi:acetyl-CoA carboxylase biotin carboxyl carrier protein
MSWLWTRRPVSDSGTAVIDGPPGNGGTGAIGLPGAAAGLLDRDPSPVGTSNRDDEDFMGQDKGSEGMRVDTDLIRQLADLLTEKDLTEIEVEDSDRRVVVRRNTVARGMAAAMGQPAPMPAAPAPAPAPSPAPAAPVGEEAAASHPGVVKSPMVGTVFLSAEPGAAPFVSAGTKVKAGDTLVIVEAMKVMNPIAAPKAGVVKQIMVQDAQPVEYDQPLVIVE